jgi:hypothetical protein
MGTIYGRKSRIRFSLATFCDVRCVMRLLLPLVALCVLASAPLRADMFDIRLTGNPGSPSGSGTFSTDGTCTLCTPGSGLLSLTVNIGPNSGMDAFDISDDALGTLTLYQRPANTLAYQGTNSETNDFLDMELNIWFLSRAGSMIGLGTYSVTPVAAVPEPSYLFPLMPMVALVGLRLRRQHRVRT